MILRYLSGWFILLIAAIANGAMRETWYKRQLGDLTAHQVSTATGIILFGFIIWGMSKLWPIPSSRQAWAIGSMWLVLTVCFEFVFGHFVMGHPWRMLFHDYNVLEGRVWILVLLWTTAAPYVFWRLHHRRDD